MDLSELEPSCLDSRFELFNSEFRLMYGYNTSYIEINELYISILDQSVVFGGHIKDVQGAFIDKIVLENID